MEWCRRRRTASISARHISAKALRQAVTLLGMALARLKLIDLAIRNRAQDFIDPVWVLWRQIGGKM